MVNYNPKERPTISQILKHEWFNAPTFKNQEETVRIRLMKEIDLDIIKSKSSIESSENDISQKV